MGDAKFGQSDLAGNVAEWVLDWNEFGDGACLKGKNTTTDCADIAAMGLSSQKLQRGGSFEDSSESKLRSSFSIGSGAEARAGYFGFRCGRAP